MRVTPGAVGSARDDGEARDSGVTLIEVMVSSVVMLIAMSIFTTGFLQIYRTINKTESLSTAQSEVTVAFQRLDRELRYAAAISAPNATTPEPDDYFVEYLMNTSGTPTCVQLRLRRATGLLQRRSWVKDAPAVTPTPWTVLVSSVRHAPPFTYVPADPDTNFQSLGVRLTVEVPAGMGGVTTRETAVTFAALNTSGAATSPQMCTEGRSVA